MSVAVTDHYEVVSQLPADTAVTFHDIGWDEYEDLLDQVGEARGLRITYRDGTLQVMTISSEHENYAWFIGRLLGVISLRLRINIRFFGSATMRQREHGKGTEPDACFYVQSAALIGTRVQLDFAADPPPDIPVDIDMHRASTS